jgi:hypothetical protein
MFMMMQHRSAISTLSKEEKDFSKIDLRELFFPYMERVYG